ncbi:MAG TPA: hypothetical protein VG167_07395 [Verrucomicrobiae bacterium]|nr:hypothetical protein [Verrucomicrobiae bacterium]
MSKKRDWVDYTQLGLSAAQAYKISEIASELGRLRKADESQEREARRLANMRQMIIVVEELLETLEPDHEPETIPQKNYVLICEAEASLQKAEIFPPLKFESFEDKREAVKLEKRLNALRDKLLKAMTDEERQEAELCWKYMVEEPDLKTWLNIQCEAKEARANQKRLAEVEVKLKTCLLTSPGGKALKGMARLGLWLLGISFLGVVLAAWAKADMAVGWFFIVLFLLGCVVFLLQFFVRLLTGDPTVPKQVRALEKERAELKVAIGEPGAGGSFLRLAAMAGDEIDVNALREKFDGETSADRLLEMYIERRDFVRGIFGKSYLAHQDTEESDKSETEEG